MATFLLLTAVILAGCQSAKSEDHKQNTTTTAATISAKAISAPDIVLYKVSNLSQPLTSIPYYTNGDVAVMPESVFTQFKQGHQPTLGNSLITAIAKTTNLTSEDILNSIDPSTSQQTNTLTTKHGISIRRTDKNIFADGDERKAEYEVTVPSIGKYTIVVEKPNGSDIFFITKITLSLSQ